MENLLSASTLSLAKQQAAKAGYTSVGDYLQELIERDADRQEAQSAIEEGWQDIVAGRMRPASEALQAIAFKYNLKVETENRQ